MQKRYFNWKLAVVLLIGLAVLGITAFGLRWWQRERRAERGLEIGNKAYDEKKWDQAAQNLGRYLAVVRDDVPALLKYADAQLNIRPIKASNVKQAETAYRNVLRIDKNNYEAAVKLAELYLAMGVPGEAELIAGKYLETNQAPELRRFLAVALNRQRKFDEAASQLESIIAEHPDQILAYETLGQFAEQRPEDFPQSPAYWFNEAVKNNPSSSLAYIVRADFHLRNGDRVSALADLERAEVQDLSDSVTRLRLARAFINAAVPDRAERHLAAVQEVEPENQTLWQTWALFALRSGSKEKMREIAERGLEKLALQSWDFLPVASELFIRCGQTERAEECISKLRRSDAAPYVITFLEGLVAELKGDTLEAVRCWRRAIESGNKEPQVRLALASALSRLGDMQSAIQQLRTLVSERPDFLDGRLALAKMLAQTGNWNEVEEHTLRVMQFSQQSSDLPAGRKSESPEYRKAALLHLQAQVQLLTARLIRMPQDVGNIQMWQDIDKQLTDLVNASNDNLEFKLLRLQIYMLRGDFEDAQALVTELKKAYPEKVNVAIAEVDLLIAQEKEDEVILEKLSETIERFPKAVEPVKYLVLLLDRQGNKEQCESVINNALERIDSPVDQRTLSLLLAQYYTRWGQQDKAYEKLNTLAKELPNDVQVKRWLLACKPIVKEPEKAQQLIDQIKSIEGDDGWQWRYEQAKLWFRADDFKDHYAQFVAFLQKNLLVNPDDRASRTLLAAAYERAGELQLAVSTYREALNRSPQDLNIIIPMVATLYKAREFDQADELLKRASQAQLYHPQLQELQFQSYLRQGQLDSATDVLEDLMAGDPNNTAASLTLALLQMQQNNFTEAGELLAKLRAKEPDSLQIAAAQVQLNVRQGDSEQALKLCDEMVGRLNNASAYILRSRTYNILQQTERAEQDLDRAALVEPNNAGIWIAKSDFYNSTAQPDKAGAAIQRALSLAPNNIEILKRTILLFLASGNPDKVREGKALLEKTLQSNPEVVELKLLKARLLLAEKTAPAIEEAGRILRQISEDQPHISNAWLFLGEIALEQGEPIKAIDIALRGLVHCSNDKPLLLLKARSEAMRSPDLAIPTLKALQELEPNDIAVVMQLADAYVASARPEKAVDILRTQLVSCKGTADERKVSIALAVALHKDGQKTEAQSIFQSLYQSVPDDPRLLLAEAQLLKDDKLWGELYSKVAGWYQDHPNDTHTPVAVAERLASIEDNEAKQTAEHILRTILEKDSDCAEATSTLAMLLQMLKRFEESAALYQRVLELQPDNVIAINNLAWILCEEQGRHQQALDIAQRGLKIAPQYVDLIDTRGVVYYRLGRFDEAVEDFTTCVKLYPSEAPSAVASRSHLGKALAKIGQKDKAINSLKEALELNTKIGGLSPTEVAETRRLLEELSHGG